MESIHQNLLVERRMELKDHICHSVHHVTNYLQSKTIISPQMTQDILCDGTMADKTYRLLDMLPTRGGRAFLTFYDATCYCKLWGAADILNQDNAPHEPNADMEENRNNINRISPDCGAQHWIRNRGPITRVLPISKMGAAIPEPTDSKKDVLTECQDLISNFKVPLNINDYITLAALERKANLEEKKAHEIVTCMASKAKQYFEAKISELTTDDRMTPEKAIRRYIFLSQPSYTDFRFFQVWGLSQPLVGPNILAVNSKTIMFLDFATKKNKDNLEWPLESLDGCRKSNDYIYSVILQFQDQNILTLLSLEFEEICRELETLMDQSSSRFGF